MNKTRQLETFVLSADEALHRGLHPLEANKDTYCACAYAGSQLVMYKWTSDYMSAAIWTLEKSVYTYTV